MNPTGDPTNPTGSVTPVLADNNQQSGSTNPTGSVNTMPSSNQPDVSGIIANYEKRLRDLMSKADKATEERNQSIASQAEMQKQLTSLQEKSQLDMAQVTSAAQSAIDQAKQFSDKLAIIEAENTRNALLLQHPDVAPYASFIPASADAEKVKQAIEQLKMINKQQLDRLALPKAEPPQTLPLQTNNIIESLYGNRPNMAPAALNATPIGQIPGSNPVSMAPMGSPEDQNKAIEQMLKEAQMSNDPVKFAAAMEEAKKRAEMLLKGVVGSSS